MTPRLLLSMAACLLAACGSMLPRGSSDTPSPFSTFAHAQAAVERIVPFRTGTGELPALGFDPVRGTNVTRIPYPEVVARLAPYPGVPLADLDRGIRECILAMTHCQAYVFRFDRLDRRREGAFWPDFLNLHRVTTVKGWWFEALVVVNDRQVLFRNFAGQANIDRVERETNPLGPFQPAGESAGAALLR